MLPDVLTGVLRSMTFPKQMRWDAALNDGKGELPFGRQKLLALARAVATGAGILLLDEPTSGV